MRSDFSLKVSASEKNGIEMWISQDLEITRKKNRRKWETDISIPALMLFWEFKENADYLDMHGEYQAGNSPT